MSDYLGGYGSSYFGSYLGTTAGGAGSSVGPLGYRDWDVIEGIISLLEATKAFDAVYPCSMPELRGQSSDDLRVAIVEPISWEEDDERDDVETFEVVNRSEFRVTVIVRDNDDLLRDREADRLHNVVRNAINGSAIIAGLCFPDLTRIRRGQWRNAYAPERQIVMTGEFSYPIFGRNDGPIGHNITSS